MSFINSLKKGGYIIGKKNINRTSRIPKIIKKQDK